MRKYITLIENLQQTSLDDFEREWLDYVLSMDDTLDEHMVRQLYPYYLNAISELGRTTLYRGIDIPIDELLMMSHIGVCWNTNIDEVSDSKTVIQARNIDLNLIDVNATLASMLTSTSEIRLQPNKQIFVASVLSDGQWHLMGKIFLT